MPYPKYARKFDQSYFPYFSRKWDSLDKSLKNTVFFKEFKGKLKERYKPIRLSTSYGPAN